MKNLSKLLTLPTLLAFTSAGNSFADPGFIQIENPMEMKFVLGDIRDEDTLRSQMIRSIYRILELSPVPIRPDDYRKLLDQVPENKRNDLIFEIATRELSECESKKNETCILPDLLSGTAFFASDPADPSQALLWTARHNVRSSYESLRNQDLLKLVGKAYRGAEIQFLLLDSKSRIVFDSRRDKDSAIVHYLWDRQTVPAAMIRGLYNAEEVLDLVAFKISGEITKQARPFQFSDSIPVDNQYVLKAGFPGATQNRFDLFEKTDSNGRNMYVSTGWSTSPAHAASYATGDFKVGSANREYYFAHSTKEDWVANTAGLNEKYGRYYFNFGTENLGGYSGSPVFDLKGRLLALYTGSMGHKLDQNYRDFAGIGLNSKWIRELVKISQDP